ncbi:MAG: heavy metal translocating P-type ATPase [Spirochaetota bacterium]
MIFQAGICALAYTAIRFYNHYQNRKLPSFTKDRQIGQKSLWKNEEALAIHTHHWQLALPSLLIFFFQIHPAIRLANLVVMVYNLTPIVRLGFHKLFRLRKVSHESLMLLFHGLCFFTGNYFAIALGVTSYHFGKKTLAKAQRDTKQELQDLLQQQMQKVWVLRGNLEIELPVEELQVGDTIVIGAGSIIPVDGSILLGTALVAEYALTGEANSVEKQKGDRVFASTLIFSGEVHILVESVGKETYIAQIAKVLEQTIEPKTTFQMKGEEWADWSALPVIGLAGVVNPFAGILGSSKVLSFYYGNNVRILGSLGTLSYLSLASSQEILVKDGRVFEELSKVDTILLDKTGTLTENHLEIAAIIPSGGSDADTILVYAATAESKLEHPIALAIVEEAKRKKLPIAKIDDSNYQIGYGITVHFAGKKIQVGSIRFIEEVAKLSIPQELQEVVEKIYNSGNSLVVIAVDERIAGIIELQTVIKPEAFSLIKDLHQRNMNIMILSGDHEKPTQKLAEKLGISDYFAEVLPEDKARIVERLQQEGRCICFIGDGVNDAIAMKKANVSISIQGATSVATNLAQVVLLDRNLTKVAALLDLAKNLHVHLQNTLRFTIALLALNISGVLWGGFSVLLTVVVNDIIGLGTGILYSMSPLRKKIKQKKIS